VNYVLSYDSADDVAAKAPTRLDDVHARGDLLMVGTFSNPQDEGSMSGVVRGRPVREWDESLAV
jgi:uncharacterized protein